MSLDYFPFGVCESVFFLYSGLPWARYHIVSHQRSFALSAVDYKARTIEIMYSFPYQSSVLCGFFFYFTISDDNTKYTHIFWDAYRQTAKANIKWNDTNVTMSGRERARVSKFSALRHAIGRPFSSITVGKLQNQQKFWFFDGGKKQKPQYRQRTKKSHKLLVDIFIVCSMYIHLCIHIKC